MAAAFQSTGTALAKQTLLTLQNVSVKYGNYVAIHDVSLEVSSGEILAIVGEHRAGKSTLAKTLAGLETPFRGRLSYNGHTRIRSRPKIEMIHQGIQTIPALTVLENIFIHSPSAFRNSTFAKRVATAQAALAELQVDISLDTKGQDLSPDEAIFVDIARAICRQPDMLIIDELDKKLAPEKLERVYRVLFRLRQQGVAIVYISNNFDELFSFANRICVMRNGRVAGIEDTQDTDKIKLINLTYDFVLSREELTQENRSLYFQKKYNETILENLNQGVVVLNELGELVQMNASAARWFQRSVKSFIGKPFSDWFQFFEFSDRSDIEETLTKKQAGSWQSIERYEELFQIDVAPFNDELQQHMGVIITIENVTEQRDVEDYLIRTEKINSVSELAAGVAHEINNPLGIIANYLNILRDDPRNVRVHGDILKIQQQLVRITDVMGSMLSFSKVSGQQNDLVDVSALLQDVLQLLGHKLNRPNLIVQQRMPEQPVVVQGNRTLLSQVFVNLIDNALEAIEGAGELHVDIRLSGLDDIVDVIISNTGPGIPADIREKLFNPFFSTKTTKKNAGLGLAICQHIVDAHHGLIFTRRDHMTRFHVRLPLIALSDEVRPEWEN